MLSTQVCVLEVNGCTRSPFLALPGIVPVTQSSGSCLSPERPFQKISTEVRCDRATWWGSAAPRFKQTECSLWETSWGDYPGVFRDNILKLFALTHRCRPSGTHFFFRSHSSVKLFTIEPSAVGKVERVCPARALYWNMLSLAMGTFCFYKRMEQPPPLNRQH